MDVVLQFSDHSHAHRVAAYWRIRDRLAGVFPHGLADDCAELSPESHRRGPALVLFSNVGSVASFNSWLANSLVENYLSRLYWLRRDTPTAPTKEAALRAMADAPVPEGMTAARIDVWPRVIQLDFGDELLEAGYPAPMHPTNYSHVLAVIQLPDGSGYRWAYTPKEAVWRLAPDKQGRYKSSVASAINKLAEAIKVLDLMPAHQQPEQLGSQYSTVPPTQQQQKQQQQQQQDQAQQAQQEQALSQPSPAPPPHQQQQNEAPVRWAIDVGASPGGWTTYLVDACGFSVIAIDPAQLHADVLARPQVHHLQSKAQDALPAVDTLLQGGKADLLVSDANMCIAVLPGMLAPLLGMLKPGGWVILTLKFYGRGPKSDADALAAALPDLEPGMMLWLMANTAYERTFIARKRSS